MYYGYTGKILEVDLSTESSVEKALDQMIAKNFIGGGLCVKNLCNELDRDVAPLREDNILVIATGQLTTASKRVSVRTEILN